MTNWQILQFPAKIFIPLVVAIENLIFSVSSPLDRLYKIHAILHNIGNGNRDHATSSKRGRSERFTT